MENSKISTSSPVQKKEEVWHPRIEPLRTSRELKAMVEHDIRAFQNYKAVDDDDIF